MDDDNHQPLLPGLAVIGANLGGVGCMVPILVIAAIFLGRELDRWLGTKPWILLGCLFSSVVIGLLAMVYSAFAAAQAAERQYRQRTDSREPLSDKRTHDEE